MGIAYHQRLAPLVAVRMWCQVPAPSAIDLHVDDMMHTLKKLFLPLLFVGTLVLTGCEANNMDDETTTLMLRLQPTVGTQDLSSDPATVYTIGDQNLTFGSARMYISEITLLRDNGEEVTFTGETITVPAKNENDETITHTTSDLFILAKHDAGDEMFTLGEVPAGVYEGVRFKLGITGTNNNIDPSQVPAGHPLAKQTDKNNHWSWNAGFIYLRIDGLLDLDGDGAVETSDEAGWNVHLGTPNFAQVIELDETFTLDGDGMQTLHLIADYARFVEDVDFSDPAQRICHTMNNLPVAQKVAADISGAFMLHGIHDGHN